MTSPFIGADELAAALAGAHPPVVLDASYQLLTPAFDGDYRAGDAADAWHKAHIPGSLYVNIQTQFSDQAAATHFTHPTAQAIADKLAALGVSMGDAVVVYDTTQTMFAARLWYLLTWIGVNVRVLDGGLAAWVGAGHPVATGAEAAREPVARWTVESERSAWVTKDELIARTESDARPLVCGLPAASFRGAAPTRYSRRGHIPGSVNVSSRDLFTEDGTVAAADRLRDAYAAEGVTGDAEVLLYCGGGISASANALTLAEIGVTAVRIYDASLEEWSADESLPLEITA